MKLGFAAHFASERHHRLIPRRRLLVAGRLGVSVFIDSASTNTELL